MVQRKSLQNSNPVSSNLTRYSKIIINSFNDIKTFTMLHLIKSNTDQFFGFLKQDPVRPNIPHDFRIGDNRDIFVLKSTDDTVKAVTCVSYRVEVPSTEDELFTDVAEPTVATFYTIWSYAPGAGRDLIFNAVDYLKKNKPTITRFVTLSPPTEMAKRFHLKNGAIVFRENSNTVNYEYTRD